MSTRGKREREREREAHSCARIWTIRTIEETNNPRRSERVAVYKVKLTSFVFFFSYYCLPIGCRGEMSFDDNPDDVWSDFGQKVDLTARLRDSITTQGTSILKELVQNAVSIARSHEQLPNPRQNLPHSEVFFFVLFSSLVSFFFGVPCSSTHHRFSFTHAHPRISLPSRSHTLSSLHSHAHARAHAPRHSPMFPHLLTRVRPTHGMTPVLGRHACLDERQRPSPLAYGRLAHFKPALVV